MFVRTCRTEPSLQGVQGHNGMGDVQMRTAYRPAVKNDKTNITTQDQPFGDSPPPPYTEFGDKLAKTGHIEA